MHIIIQILLALFRMVWEIAWGLALGFILSSLTRAFISAEAISLKLGKDSVGALSLSSFFGAISSSCSYAAASMARALVIKGATWSNAVAFMVSSTNLVFEIFIVIVTLLGWSFFGGEVAGGIIFIILSALFIIWFFPKSIGREAREQANSDVTGGNQHAHCCKPAHGDEKLIEMAHDHSHHANIHHPQQSSFKEKLKQASVHFYMDVNMVGKDILIGVVVSAVMMVLVPDAFWKSLFLTGNSTLPHFLVLAWNTIIGILIAIFAFVCSVGNIVLANVLWQGGISFGGVIAFILSDLVTFPMLMVYRKYYGLKTMWYLLIIFSVSIFITALLLDYSFAALHWIPKSPVHSMDMQRWKFEWNYITWLNFIFIPASVYYFFAGRKTMK
ncbi:MAG: permease [Bacteroidota bacterium]|nr:permease [Bacteroidota bacterium]